MPEWESNPFQNSLSVLAQFALQTTGAQGFAFFQKNQATGCFALLASGGAVIRQVRADRSLSAIVEYPLRDDGVINASVAFGFSNETDVLQARPRLDTIARTLQRVWAAAATDRYASLVERVADLEAHLMDLKVADRARGLLMCEPDPDPAEVIARHVDSVLRPTQTHRLLEQVLSELEDEIEERRLVAEAKQILQALYQVSEEQAHKRLRLLSRRSRKPLKEVALQVIEDRQLE